jgi:hypothetical protein
MIIHNSPFETSTYKILYLTSTAKFTGSYFTAAYVMQTFKLLLCTCDDGIQVFGDKVLIVQPARDGLSQQA